MTAALLGVPWDEHSSLLRGAALAPPAIRAAIASPSSNRSTESGLDLGSEPRFRDAGDLDLTAGAGALESIERGVRETIAGGERVLVLADKPARWQARRREPDSSSC